MVGSGMVFAIDDRRRHLGSEVGRGLGAGKTQGIPSELGGARGPLLLGRGQELAGPAETNSRCWRGKSPFFTNPFSAGADDNVCVQADPTSGPRRRRRSSMATGIPDPSSVTATPAPDMAILSLPSGPRCCPVGTACECHLAACCGRRRSYMAMGIPDPSSVTATPAPYMSLPSGSRGGRPRRRRSTPRMAQANGPRARA